jgi:hypothetical protein
VELYTEREIMWIGLNWLRMGTDIWVLISGFRRDVDEICALLGYYAASNGNPLPTFRDVSVPFSRVKKSKKFTLEYGTDTLSRNVGKQLLHDAA